MAEVAERLAAARLGAAELEERLAVAERALAERDAEAAELREYAQSSAEALLEERDRVAELQAVADAAAGELVEVREFAEQQAQQLAALKDFARSANAELEASQAAVAAITAELDAVKAGGGEAGGAPAAAEELAEAREKLRNAVKKGKGIERERGRLEGELAEARAALEEARSGEGRAEELARQVRLGLGPTTSTLSQCFFCWAAQCSRRWRLRDMLLRRPSAQGSPSVFISLSFMWFLPAVYGLVLVKGGGVTLLPWCQYDTATALLYPGSTLSFTRCDTLGSRWHVLQEVRWW